MKAIKQIKKIRHNKVTLRVPPDFGADEAEIIIIPHQKKKKYNFADLSGKLGWTGNAIKEQRRLRDEWE